MPGLLGQLRQIEKLGSPVSLSEGVNVVHVAHDLPGRGSEVCPAQATQEGGPRKALVNIPHAGFDKAAELELMLALRNLHGAKLARPIVNILEQMPVDGAKVGEVEAPGWDALGGPLRDKAPLHAVKPGRVRKAQLVS